MFLSNVDIQRYIDSKEIQIYPSYDPKDIQQYGLRVHLDPIIYERKSTADIIDMRNPLPTSTMQKKYFKEKDLCNETQYLLEPNNSILGCTSEGFILPNDLFMLLDGRSTLARLGITTHLSSCIVDNLNRSSPKSVVLEIFNFGKQRLILYPEMPIAMVLFGKLSSETTLTPSEHYIDKQILPNVQYSHDKGII